VGGAHLADGWGNRFRNKTNTDDARANVEDGRAHKNKKVGASKEGGGGGKGWPAKMKRGPHEKGKFGIPLGGKQLCVQDPKSFFFLRRGVRSMEA